MSFDVPSHQEAETTTSAETAVEAVTPRQVAAEMQAPLDKSHHDRNALQHDIESNLWAHIPMSARDYIEQQCAQKQNPEIFALAMNEASKSLESDPTAFDDPDLASFELDFCIEKAEIAAIDAETASETARADQAETRDAEEKAEGRQLNTANVVLSEQEKQLSAEISKMYTEEAARGGGVDALIGRVSERLKSMPPGTAKQTAVQKMAQVRATLGQMRSVVTNPQERAAFESILSTANLNLGGGNSSTVFADVMAKVDASEAISEETKTKLRVEAIGIPPFRDSSEMLGTLEQVRANEGKFRNADGQVVEFNEHNGVPVGRYTVHPDPNDHDEYIATAKVGGRTLKLPFSPDTDPNLLDEQMSAIMVAQVLANRDLQTANRYILGGDGLAAQGVNRIKLDEFQVKRAEQLYGAFMGFGTELRTGFPNQSDLVEFERRLQATHIDGDAKTNDNTGHGDLSWLEIGMIDQNGDINMQKVEAVGAYVNQAPVALRQYDELVREFGDKTEQ